MNGIEILQQYIQDNYPKVTTELTIPLHKEGVYFLEIWVTGSILLMLQWSQARDGYGLSIPVDGNTQFMMGADEWVATSDEIRTRVDETLSRMTPG